MKEEFTINKPHIANEFANVIYEILEVTAETKSKQSPTSNTVFSIKEKDLKNCLIKLGTMVQERERLNFEQYTMFYENLLRQQHQILYGKEREIASLKDNLEKQQISVNVEVQSQMADTCYDLIMGTSILN
jgi:hypothetical protein